MNDTFSARIIEGFTAPRASARRMLDQGLGLDSAILMVVFGYLLSAIAHLIIAPEVSRPEGGFISYHLVSLMLQIGIFFLIAGMAFGLGKISGGTGTLPQAQVLVGWHSLVTSMMAPVWVFAAADVMGKLADASAAAGEAPIDPSTLEISGTVVFVALAVAALWFWLLANYVSELHAFKNVWGVLGVMCGLPVAIAVFLMWTATAVSLVGAG